MKLPPALEQLSPLLEKSQLNIWQASVENYLLCWQNYFSQSHANSHLRGQDNLLSYVPYPKILLRVRGDDSFLDMLRVVAAAYICNATLQVSFENKNWLKEPLRQLSNVEMIVETDVQFMQRINQEKIGLIRFLAPPSEVLQQALANAASHFIVAPVLANGRVELLNYLRELSLSHDYHRYGHLSERE